MIACAIQLTRTHPSLTCRVFATRRHVLYDSDNQRLTRHTTGSTLPPPRLPRLRLGNLCIYTLIDLCRSQHHRLLRAIAMPCVKTFKNKQFIN